MRGDRVGEGRDTVVLEHEPGWVLRRPRVSRSLDAEADVMRWAADHGYPAPAVGEPHPDGLVLERVDGPTMLADLLASPDRLAHHLALLADLHHQLHALPPAPGLARRYGAGEAIVHGDLHPDNVILSARGPVVIDWTNAGLGDPGADAALVWLLMACAAPPDAGGATQTWLDALTARGELDAARAALPLVLDDRRRDPHLAPDEIDAMERLVAAQRRSSQTRS